MAAQIWPPIFGRPILAAQIWPPIFGRPILAAHFWPPTFGRPILAAQFWLPFSGRPFLASQIWPPILRTLTRFTKTPTEKRNPENASGQRARDHVGGSHPYLNPFIPLARKELLYFNFFLIFYHQLKLPPSFSVASNRSRRLRRLALSRPSPGKKTIENDPSPEATGASARYRERVEIFLNIIVPYGPVVSRG